jgi:hypothetical protein
MHPAERRAPRFEHGGKSAELGPAIVGENFEETQIPEQGR